MPMQTPQWTEFLSCPICFNIFDERNHRPISLACGHTVCRLCLSKLVPKKCPFDQNVICRAIEELPVNFALLQLVGVAVPEEGKYNDGLEENVEYYNSARKCIEELAMYLKPVNDNSNGTASPVLSRPMQRKLVTLVNSQLIEDEGRCRAVRAARSLGERTVTELILQHQNPQQLSANLWAGVRARGCQFLGPAMQEEVLKLILLALEDGSALSRKVLVLFVVQRLESQYPQASKTAIGHVVQLLYRASCFKVTKRDEESSLMQLKEDLRTYESLRREHDSQIVQIATEAGLRISPEQWSSLLYGDTAHKSHMQSIIDKLQTPQSFVQSIAELSMALQRTGDPGGLMQLKSYLDLLASIDPGPEIMSPTWECVNISMKAIKIIVEGLIDFSNSKTVKKPDLMPLHNPKYKTSMCRDLGQKGKCPRGAACTFAHSQEEMEMFRQRSKKVSLIVSDTSLPMLVQSQPELCVTPQLVQHVMTTAKTEIHGKPSNYPPSENAVTIPVVKPCSLPSNTRAKMESSIYSSPMLNVEDHERDPDNISVSNRMSCVQQGGLMMPYNGVLSPLAYQPWVNAAVPACVGDGSASTTSTRSTSDYVANPPELSVTTEGEGDEVSARQQHMMMMPPNPYTINRYGLNARDTAYYNSMVIRSRGKSPSKQLEELQNRKKELLSQLHKTSVTSITTTTKSTDSNVIAISDAVVATVPTSSMYSYDQQFTVPALLEVNPKVSNSGTTNGKLSVAGNALGTSVADSRAITLVTMTLANCSTLQECGVNEEVVIEEDYSEYEEDNIKTEHEMTSQEREENYIIWSNAEDEEQNAQFYTTQANFEYASGNSWYEPITTSRHIIDDNDEFVPFKDEAEVSKYGPISRMIKTKMEQTAPVQVTAGQPRDTFPVTAVTPVRRPHPIASQIPSVFNNKGNQQQSPLMLQSSPPSQLTPLQAGLDTAQLPSPLATSVPPPPANWQPKKQSESPIVAVVQPTMISPPAELQMSLSSSPTDGKPSDKESKILRSKQSPENAHPSQQTGDHGDHQPDPNGVFVATSLPTALLQPNVIATANRSEANELWTQRQRLFDPNQRPVASTSNVTGREMLQNDIAHITHKIQHLRSSEDDRLVRELKSIEINIKEATRQVEQEHKDSPPPFVTVNYSVPPAGWKPYCKEQPVLFNQPHQQQAPVINFQGQSAVGLPGMQQSVFHNTQPIPTMALGNNGQQFHEPQHQQQHHSQVQQASLQVYHSPQVITEQQQSAQLTGFQQLSSSGYQTIQMQRPVLYPSQPDTQKYVGYIGKPLPGATFNMGGHPHPMSRMPMQGDGIGTMNSVHFGQINTKDAMDFQVAREAQLMAISRQQARIEQESNDRKYAEDIAMQEVERFVRSSIAEDD